MLVEADFADHDRPGSSVQNPSGNLIRPLGTVRVRADLEFPGDPVGSAGLSEYALADCADVGLAGAQVAAAQLVLTEDGLALAVHIFSADVQPPPHEVQTAALGELRGGARTDVEYHGTGEDLPFAQRHARRTAALRMPDDQCSHIELDRVPKAFQSVHGQKAQPVSAKRAGFPQDELIGDDRAGVELENAFPMAADVNPLSHFEGATGDHVPPVRPGIGADGHVGLDLVRAAGLQEGAVTGLADRGSVCVHFPATAELIRAVASLELPEDQSATDPVFTFSVREGCRRVGADDEDFGAREHKAAAKCEASMARTPCVADPHLVHVEPVEHRPHSGKPVDGEQAAAVGVELAR